MKLRNLVGWFVGLTTQFAIATMAHSQQSQLPPCVGYSTSIWTNCVGTYTFANGNKYVGEYRSGKINGQGTLTNSNGDKYVGEFIDGKLHGQGTWSGSNGDKYVGEWKDNKKNGQGTYTWADGNKYVGEFIDGKLHGQGTWSGSNGDKYVGEFIDGKLHGQGTLTNSNGNKYVGEYRDDKRNGQGTYTWANGNKYVGEYKDDKRNGWGIFSFADGRQYVGEWVDDKNNGLGVFYDAQKQPVRTGRFQNDMLVESMRLDPVRFAYVSQPTLASVQPAPTPIAASPAANTEDQRKQAAEIERLRLEAERAREDKRRAEEALAQVQQQQSQQSVSKPATISRNVDAHALVIGNAAYPGGNRLDNPVNDARAISQKLRALGFKVTEVVDANRARLVSALGQFNKSAANAELSLLFYSGHGVQVFGTNYILPIDVDQTDPAQATLQGVSLNSAVEQFMPGKTKLVFLDACRDNPFVRSGSRGVSKGLAPISVAQGTLIAYATKDGQVASDGVGQKNSPFTTALLQHLDDPQDIAIVLRKVRERVVSTTNGKQEPWEYGSLTGGELILSRINPLKK